jgi:hypothetical protein
VGASVEGELHLSWMQMFPSPFMPFILFFFFQEASQGHCPCLVISGGNVSHKHFTEMGRLARDETPFLLAMPPRATTLAWWPDAGSVISLDAYGPNRLARDETPYPLTRSCLIVFYLFIAFFFQEASQGTLP